MPRGSIITNEWIDFSFRKPIHGRFVLTKTLYKIDPKSPEPPLELYGIYAWNGANWINQAGEKQDIIVHKWYMFEYDTSKEEE